METRVPGWEVEQGSSAALVWDLINPLRLPESPGEGGPREVTHGPAAGLGGVRFHPHRQWRAA